MSDLTKSVKAAGLDSTGSNTSSSSNLASKSAVSENNSTSDKLGFSNPAFWYSGSFIAAFVLLALYDEALLSSLVNTGFGWSVKVFGPYWQLLLLLTFLINAYCVVYVLTLEIFKCSNSHLEPVIS